MGMEGGLRIGMEVEDGYGGCGWVWRLWVGMEVVGGYGGWWLGGWVWKEVGG